jgi:hypothetical protein
MNNTKIIPETTRETYQNLIENNPEITADGFGHGTPTHEESRMALEDHYGAFVASVQWIHDHADFDRSRSSYGLKHESERDMRVYIPNGVFILAALHEGFRIKDVVPNTPNVRLH